MDTIFWNLNDSSGANVLASLWRPFLIGMVLYFSGYWQVWFIALLHKARLIRGFRGLAGDERIDILVVIPTMLRTRAELEELRSAAETVVANRYPGNVVLSMAIDGSAAAPALAYELETWARRRSSPGMTILVAQQVERGGKGVAVAAGLSRAQRAAACGEIPSVPAVFFNMDADSELGPRALERMVAKLVRPGLLWRQKPMIVASNVLVRHEHYWAGLGNFFTVRYQLALQVAREYMTSISISRNNRGVLPVTGVSGALYCTWTAIHDEQAKHAAFMHDLRWRDLAKWWIGCAPPSYAAYQGTANVEATAGPGDDTWLAWLAMAARWKDGALDLELPRTPLHALYRLVRSFFVRKIAYDPQARVYTATPTTIRGLFKQRVRWNSSRAWLLQRFGVMPYFAWHVGVWVVLDMLLTIAIHAVVFVALLGAPFASRPAAWLAFVALGVVTTFAIRTLSTLLAIMQEDDMREHWHKLLALPLAGIFHLTFNLIPTIVGLIEEFFLFGCNTHFAPESTLAASHVGRPALAYRIARAAKLTGRALRRGDVPPGAFWFGWNATRWTANGYAGWTDPAKRIGRGGVLKLPR